MSIFLQQIFSLIPNLMEMPLNIFPTIKFGFKKMMRELMVVQKSASITRGKMIFRFLCFVLNLKLCVREGEQQQQQW
jgi:hypothetical protein